MKKHDFYPKTDPASYPPAVLPMSYGLVFGKFMPLHTGHLALVEHALAHCDRVLLLVCAQPHEEIPGPLRFRWATETWAHIPRVTVAYTDVRLPYTDYSSREISRIWGAWFKQTYPDLTHVCTSEPYGDYLAEYMQVIHLPFDPGRVRQPISARQIRMDPMRYWEYLPAAVRPHYVRKVCIYGPESTGKSTLAARLAAHFDTVQVPEMARDLIPDSTGCTWDDLEQVVTAQTEAVERLARQARRVLICDTDLLTTQVYARYLFQRELQVTPEQEAVHQYHLYLVPDTDVPYVQDGTRLGAHTQDDMKRLFINALEDRNIMYRLISGDWESRFRQAVQLVTAVAGY